MSNSEDHRLHKVGENVDFWWKVVRAIVGFVGLVGLAWVQFLGPGLKSGMQEFIGMREVINRIEFIEAYMPAPRVVEWDETRSRQNGDCNTDKCVYILTGSRTEYGETCGRPTSATPFLRTKDGQVVQIEYDGFTPVELGRSPRTFQIPLAMPSFIPPGDHAWRTLIEYPTCSGTRDGGQRFTPWFPITVSD